MTPPQRNYNSYLSAQEYSMSNRLQMGLRHLEWSLVQAIIEQLRFAADL